MKRIIMYDIYTVFIDLRRIRVDLIPKFNYFSMSEVPICYFINVDEILYEKN